mgnify:CR=1 FL=1
MRKLNQKRKTTIDGTTKYIKEAYVMKKVIEIHAADGGDDSKLFIADLAQAYIKLAQRMS